MFILKIWLLCRINFLHKDVPFLKLGDCTFQQAPKLCQTHAYSCPFVIHGGVKNSKLNANTYIVHIWRHKCIEVWLYACTCSFWMVWTRQMWHLRHMGPIVHNLGPCVSQVSHCNGKTLLTVHYKLSLLKEISWEVYDDGSEVSLQKKQECDRR